MIEFVYPAVLYVDEEQLEPFCIYFPDLDISTEGTSIEEAFLFAKDYLRQYLELALKNDFDYPLPSKYQTISKKYSKYKTLLIDIIIDENKIKQSKAN